MIENTTKNSALLFEQSLATLVSLGKHKGYVLFNQIESIMESVFTDAYMLEQVISELEDKGIHVLEEAPDEDDEKTNNIDINDPDEDLHEPATTSIGSKELGRTSDPTRMYMREMSDNQLLLRIDEISISRQIEAAKRELLDIIYNYPRTYQIFDQNFQGISKQKHKIGELITGFAWPDDSNISDVDFLAEINNSENCDFVKPPPPFKFPDLEILKNKLEKAQSVQEKIKVFSSVRPALQFTGRVTDDIASFFKQIKAQEKMLSSLFVDKLSFPRKDVIKAYNECNDGITWVKKLSKKSKSTTSNHAYYSQYIQHGIKSLENIQQKVQFTIAEIKHAHNEVKRVNRLIQKGKDQMTEANLRLVISIAKKYSNRGLQFLDVIQEGNIGLMKAIDKYEFRRGYKFSTYATWWIRQAITRSIADQARTVRVPVHMIETINKLKKVQRSLLQEKKRNPTLEELAEGMEIPTTKLQQILKISLEPSSIDAPVGDGDESTLGDFIADDNLAPPSEVSENLSLKETLESLMMDLGKRERDVIMARYGMGTGTELTLEDVGVRFELTRERIRQIESKALKKLRHPQRYDKLISFIK